MSTDNDMDAMLRDAGSRWRAAHSGSASSVDFDVITPVAQPSRRRNWLLVASAALIVAALAVGSAWFAAGRDHSPKANPAGPVSSGDTHGLTGIRWQLLMASGPTENSGPSGSSQGLYPPLEFNADGTVLANDGCNSISGPATIGASTITFGALATSAMGCTLDAGGTYQEHLIQTVLQGTVSWKVEDDGVGRGSSHLTITNAGAGTLVYEGKLAVQPVIDPAKMQGTWQLTNYTQTAADNNSGSGGGAAANGGGSAGGSSGGFEDGLGDILTINADGTFKIQHRCYTDAGQVGIGSGTAAWSGVHPDGAVPCPAIADPQTEHLIDALVDHVLSGSTTWTIDTGGSLTITKDPGNDLGFSPYASDNGTPSGSPTN